MMINDTYKQTSFKKKRPIIFIESILIILIFMIDFSICKTVLNVKNRNIHNDLNQVQRIRIEITNGKRFFQIENQSLFYMSNSNLSHVADYFFKVCKSQVQLKSVEKSHMCFSNVKELDLSANQIKHIPTLLTNHFFHNLKTLNLSSNLIGNISSFNDLSGMASRFDLEVLDLSFNQIDFIDEENFRYLKSLRHLNLANNQIKFIHLFAFSSDLHNLIELNLNHNKIKDNSMEFLLFSSLTSLEVLRMSYNQITSVSSHLLYNLYSLKELYLNDNDLKAFDLLYKSLKNNELLRLIDVSFNRNFKLELILFEQSVDYASPNYVNNVEILNLSGLSFHGLNMNTFLDLLFDSYKNLQILNISSSNIKSSVWSNKWPSTIQTIDLSHNLLKDKQFDCHQFLSHGHGYKHLKTILLNNNRIEDFGFFIDTCLKFYESRHQSVPDLQTFEPITIDLRFNNIKSLNSLSTDNLQSCTHQQNKNVLMLDGNPLVCDCELNNWWSNVHQTDLKVFQVKNHQTCLIISDYDQLSCKTQSWSNTSSRTFANQTLSLTPIRNDLISTSLICPYKSSCSKDTCECCEFKACDCSLRCPESCDCVRDYAHKFNSINCSYTDLYEMPILLPISSTELLLAGNNLKHIKSFQFFGLNLINKIDLSRNRIVFIEENSFQGLTNLKSLNISHNNLQALIGYEFNELYHLEELYLNNNQLKYISNNSFVHLINLKYLNLQANYLQHNLDSVSFFGFNINLLELKVDKSEMQALVQNALAGRNEKNTKIEEKLGENIRKLVQTRLRNQYFNINKIVIELMSCFMDKYKSDPLRAQHELDLIQNELDFSASEPNLNNQVNLKLRKNLLHICSNSASKSLLLRKYLFDGQTKTNANDEYNVKLSPLLNVPQQLDLSDDSDAHFSLTLNLKSLIMLFLILVILLILLSAFLVYVLMKFKKNLNDVDMLDANKFEYNLKSFKRVFFSLCKKFFDYLKRSNKTANNDQVDMSASCKDSLVEAENHVKKKACNTTASDYIVHHQSNETTNSKSIKRNSHHQLVLSYYSSVNLKNNDTIVKPLYDLFIVYNRLDSNLVTSSIVPTFTKKEFNLSIVLLHKDSQVDRPKLSKAEPSNNNNNNATTKHSHNIQHKTFDDQIELINSSSFVLFVLTENFFTELEYKISSATPNEKKIVVLADDINDSFVERFHNTKKLLENFI
jgi:hypothetical protein